MSSSGNWRVLVDPSVLKTVKKLPRHDAERILRMLHSLERDPYRGDVKKLKGEMEVWRQRVGPYRIFYEIFPEKKISHVFLVERRTSKIYRKH